LIVDQFSALREEVRRLVATSPFRLPIALVQDDERQDTLTNECYVCGFKRSAYDDVGLTHGPAFDVHRDQDHYLWNYVFYFTHLRR
jgi:hypothetical protein